MKVAIACDHILRRSYAHRVVEALLGIYRADLYTLAHRPGAGFERHRVGSSYLTRLVKSERELWGRLFLVPSAAQKLRIEGYDLVFAVSSGLAHGIATSCPQIVYCLGDGLWGRSPRTWREKIFSPWLRDWSGRGLEKALRVWAASPALRKQIGLGGAELLDPPLKLQNYPLFPPSVRARLSHGACLVEAENLPPAEARELVKLFKTRGWGFKFLGDHSHLRELKNELNERRFATVRCAGELAPLLAGARVYIDLRPGFFPERALLCLALGRPVIVGEPHELLGPGRGVFVASNGIGPLIDHLDQQSFEGAKLRALVQRFHQLKFQAEVKRRVGGISSLPRP